MSAKKYIGITGPVTVEEVNNIGKEFESVGITPVSEHQPMIGILASYKTLQGQETTNRRYPRFSEVRGLLQTAKPYGMPVVHYNSKEVGLDNQLGQLFRGISEETCRAVQLNIPWPNVKELERAKKEMPELEIIIQLSRTTMDGQNPREIVSRVKEYEHVAEYLLIDPSGGKGREFDIDRSVEIYQELQTQLPRLMVGFAGGFTGENVARRTQELIRIIGGKNFCIDAEGGLRDKLSDIYGDDILNITKVRRYIEEASKGLN